MSTRMEIELTSASTEGQWTWRAAGARAPRGTVDASLLPTGASVGDQLKAETEKDLDGIRILSIVAPKGKGERAGLLELLPSSEKFEPVVEVRATRDRHDARGRPRRDRDDRGERAPRGDRRERTEGAKRTERNERTDRTDRTDRAQELHLCMQHLICELVEEEI